MSELKPCPFCGSTDIKLHDEISHAVWCQECFAEVPSIDIESAIKLWHTRPIEDALNARIAELEAEQRWIPVSERLPEVDQDVLVFDQRGDITIDYLVALNREGVAYYTNSDDGAVCWMPLPVPPIMYGKVCE